MKTSLVLVVVAVVAILVASSVPSWAVFATPSNPFFNQENQMGRGPQQNNQSFGWQYRGSVPDYGFWAVGPDYGNYRWPFTGPYGANPRGRPLDNLTYAPFPVAAEAASVKNVGDHVIQVSWPGRPDAGVVSVDFTVLGEAGEPLTVASVNRYPFTTVMRYPWGAQRIRIMVHYCDGFSSAVMWLPQ